MSTQNLFNAGPSSQPIPQGDTVRQAVASLRGYAYQVLATALAWLEIDEIGQIYLEVAEDYAIVAENALHVVQVKDTHKSGSVTLNSKSVHDAIAAFIDHVEKNPSNSVDLRFFTTSEIGQEQAIADRLVGVAGLEYWKQAAAGMDLKPLREVLESDKFPDSVRTFSKARNDKELRSELIQRISWDCGKPDFSTLRQELVERLIVVGRDLFGLPAQEASRLVDHLVYQVLTKSIVNNSCDRVLTRATLYSVIDAVTRISVPRAALDDFTRVVSELISLLGGSPDNHNLLFADERDWLVDGATLPTPQGMIKRPDIESAVTNALKNFGFAVLAGSSGLGKSIISRTVADAQASGFFMADFRNTNANEARSRLDLVFTRIGGLPPSTLILEDLNHLDDAQVSLSLGRVVEAMRRRYRVLIVTCYAQPSLIALTSAGLDPGCIVECPYFSEQEAFALVGYYGGEPKIWGRLAYSAGGSGHPQLTHAFVNGMAMRGWPVEEIENILAHGLSSGDTDSARDAARQNLLIALPDRIRTLLYRLSLAFSGFHRSMALIIGEISPSVTNTGECLDHLIGPWVETVGNDLFRVSPLTSDSGRKMLHPDEQRRIHETIAIQMLAKRTIDVRDFNIILVHAFACRSAVCLTNLAYMVLSADSRTTEQLAEHDLFFRFATTDAPIYREDALVSVVLRLVQFKLAATTSSGNIISRIVAALFDEIGAIPEGERKHVIECVALQTVLSTKDIANYLDDWVALLLRHETIIETDEFLQGRVTDLEDTDDRTTIPSLIGLFNIGSANLATPDRLEHIINQLDRVQAALRSLLLSPIDKTQSDYSSFINRPWLSQQLSADFDAVDAAERYGRMAEKTLNWGIPPLSHQCSVAQAIILDEYLNDREGAMAVLKEAGANIGNDPILNRALAKIYLRHDEHDKALAVFRGIVDQVGVESPVERAFALREAAISAAKCREWQQAEEWFLCARDSARLIQRGDMEVMAIGLGADSAVAALESDNPGQAITQLSETLGSLININPESTLYAAYCHRVIRHTVLWAQSRIERQDVRIGGNPILVEPGTCSNPDPLPAIRELPLAHIDVVWYMLAEIEVVTGLDTGILAGFEYRLEDGQIPVLECSLRLKAIQADIDRLDAVGFSNHFTSYLETSAYMLKDGRSHAEAFDSTAPERGQIPTLDLFPPFDPGIEHAAKDAILAYAIHSVLAYRLSAMTKLETELRKGFMDLFPGESVFDDLGRNANTYQELDKIVVSIIWSLFQNEYLKPEVFWLAAIRLYQWICQSQFKELLVPKLAVWQRTGWRRILAKEKFNLVRPMQTVPPIEATLKISQNDQSFIKSLLVTTSYAMDLQSAKKLRETLR